MTVEMRFASETGIYFGLTLASLYIIERYSFPLSRRVAAP